MKKRILAKALAIAMVITTAFLPSNCILAETTDTVIKNDETGIPDTNLYNVLLKAADSDADNILTTSELETVMYLDAEDSNIVDLKGLAYCKNLNILDLSNNDITSIDELLKLPNLSSLYIERNELSDITVLGSLTNLTLLDIIGLDLKDISVVSKLTNLKTLWFDNNSVEDITPVAGLTNLVDLQFGGNNVADISCLSQLVNLKTLNIRWNQVSNIDVVANFKEITNLYMFDNQISDISPVRELTGLTTLEASNNIISDISALKDLNNLTDLDLSYNKISDFTVLEGKNIEHLNIENQIIEEPENPNESETPNEPEVPSGSETPGEPETPNANRDVYDIKENPIITIEKFGELLEANKEQDVVIQVGNNISITFGKGTMNVVEGMSQYDFTTAIVSDYTQANIPLTIQSGDFISKVVFHYSGKLPAEASIRIPVGVQHVGKTVYYTLLKDDGTFGTAQVVVVDAEGYITVKQDHCSSYVITTENPNTVVSAPKTGDDFGVMWMMVIAVGVTMSVLCIMKSRRVIKR